LFSDYDKDQRPCDLSKYSLLVYADIGTNVYANGKEINLSRHLQSSDVIL
jgi:hypothetical protein